MLESLLTFFAIVFCFSGSIFLLLLTFHAISTF